MTDIIAWVPDRWLWEREGTCLYCDEDILARRLCSMHYNRWWRDGKLEIQSTMIGPWLCEGSDLDFLTRPGPQGRPVLISANHSRKHAKEYRAQIAVCLRCTTRAECAELGASESVGIWGGMLPHEREER